MATPYTNAVSMTHLSFSGLTTYEKGLIDGWKWGAGGYGNGVTLTFSFGHAGSSYASSDYNGFEHEWLSPYVLNSVEQAAVRQVLAEVELGADISFVKTADSESTVGELRFTGTANADYAHAYLPYDNNVRSGDVWFAHGGWNPTGAAVTPGSYEYMTIIHEVGHALGLKHSFDTGESGVALPPEYDHYQWSLMSYSAHEGAGLNVWADFYPTTMMYLDLVALEKMYGPAENANLGGTEYVYRQGGRYWETISDSGGIDTIVYDATTQGCVIDLSNGEFSQMGRPIHFSDGTTTRETICIGPSTVIENATGGGGGDRLIGNGVRNFLIGNGGNDQLTGNAGADDLNGGGGRDRLLGGSGSDTLWWSAGDLYDGGTHNDSLRLAAGNLDLTGLSNSQFISVEKINLSGAGANTLTLKAGDVLSMSASGMLEVLGGSPDTVNLVGAFEFHGRSGGFETWTYGGATLRIESAIDVV
jgi:Ca2+-binding RTX toxin-like protein